MKDKKPLDWIPIYIDKHIFGSTRLELEPDERSVWQDLLIFSGKDNGYIRANEGVPYPLEQLAGLFVISMELLKRTIKKCSSKEVGKIEMQEDGTMYLSSYPQYKLSARHKRRFEQMSAETATMSKKAATRVEKSIDIDRVKIERKKKNIKRDARLKKENEELEKEFTQFWNLYNYKVSQGDALKAFNAIRRKGVSLERILKCTKGYQAFVKSKRVHNGFDQKIKYPAGFLRNDYLFDYEDIKYKPPL